MPKRTLTHWIRQSRPDLFVTFISVERLIAFITMRLLVYSLMDRTILLLLVVLVVDRSLAFFIDSPRIPSTLSVSPRWGAVERLETPTEAVAPLSMRGPPYTVGKAILLLPHNADTQLSQFGRNSPFGTPTLLEAATHLAKKAYFFSNATVDVDVAMIHNHGEIRILTSSSSSTNREEQLVTQPESVLISADALIAMSIQQDTDVAFLQRILQQRNTLIQEQRLDHKCQFCIDCTIPSTDVDEFVSTHHSQHASFLSQILVSVPFTKQASAKRLYLKMKSLFERWTSDDFTIALMLFFNQYPTLHLHDKTFQLDGTFTPQIDWVKHSIDATWEKGPIRNMKEFYTMITKCGGCIGRCMSDTQCRECITKLSTIDTRDQVESYRTIVSYDGSELLKEFSLCILQKNNVFQCDATIPTLPFVEPLKVWRGMPLTQDIAQSLLIGHLDEETALQGSLRGSTSWKVAAGANVAYDQFPSQNQLFYNGLGKTMWYDPIFRVKTIDGRDIWCKRHYRVRSGSVPGTFRFSVLDNGVTSDEFWTIVAADDNLQWIILHYAGAASAVGLQYLGGLLCTIDGSLPTESEREMIWGQLRKAGIEPWELFAVDNDSKSPALLAAGPPPLDFYRRDVRIEASKVESNSNR